MKHTDLYQEYKKLEAIEREELAVAVKAHGGEYIFIHVDDDGDFDADERDSNAPIISASASWMGDYVDFYVSLVKVDENNRIVLYGWPKEGYDDEDLITEVAIGQYSYITDMIPPTDELDDVSGMRLKN